MEQEHGCQNPGRHKISGRKRLPGFDRRIGFPGCGGKAEEKGPGCTENGCANGAAEKMREAKISEFSEYARLACLQVSPIVLDSEGLHLLDEIRQNIAYSKNLMQLLESLTSRLKC